MSPVRMRRRWPYSRPVLAIVIVVVAIVVVMVKPVSQLTQPDLVDPMVGTLDEDQVRALASRQDVLPEVRAVDRVPDGAGRSLSLVVGEAGISMEIRLRLLERGGPQEQEPLDVPVANVGLRRVDVDAEVEEVRDEHARFSRTVRR